MNLWPRKKQGDIWLYLQLFLKNRSYLLCILIVKLVTSEKKLIPLISVWCEIGTTGLLPCKELKLPSPFNFTRCNTGYMPICPSTCLGFSQAPRQIISLLNLDTSTSDQIMEDRVQLFKNCGFHFISTIFKYLPKDTWTEIFKYVTFAYFPRVELRYHKMSSEYTSRDEGKVFVPFSC